MASGCVQKAFGLPIRFINSQPGLTFPFVHFSWQNKAALLFFFPPPRNHFSVAPTTAFSQPRERAMIDWETQVWVGGWGVGVSATLPHYCTKQPHTSNTLPHKHCSTAISFRGQSVKWPLEGWPTAFSPLCLLLPGLECGCMTQWYHRTTPELSYWPPPYLSHLVSAI